MKKQFRFLLLAIMASIMSVPFYSCDNDEGDEPEAAPSFYSGQKTHHFTEDGGTLECAVLNGNPYTTTVVSTEPWLSASLSEYDTSCLISISENKTQSPREGMVTLLSKGRPADFITILQDAGSSSGGGGSDPGDQGEFGAPTGLSLSKDGYAVTLTWNAVPKAVQYHIYYSNPIAYDSGNFVTMHSTTSTSYTMNCKIAGNWAFKIQAYDGNNYSEYSNTVSTSISESDINGGGSPTGKPGKPTGLKANVNGTQVSVSWNASSGASYYRLYYVKPAPYDIESFDNVYATSTTMNCTIKGTWTIWVVAVGSNYEASDPSSKVTFTINSSGSGSGGGDSDKPSQLDTPTGLTVNSLSTDPFVQLQCNGVTLGYDYQLYRSSSPGSGYTKINASVASNSNGSIVYFTDSSPKKGTTYYKVKVAALSYLGIKDSEFSNYVKVVR